MDFSNEILAQMLEDATEEILAENVIPQQKEEVPVQVKEVKEVKETSEPDQSKTYKDLKKEEAKKEKEKARELFTKSPNYEDESDLDKNEFILEGKIDSLYTPENKAVTFVKIIYENKATGILNFPQVKVFKNNFKILGGIKEGDYVRIWGNINSQKRILPDKSIFMSSTYVARSIKKVEPRQTQRDPFFDRFDMHSESKTNTVLVSGLVSDVRIIGENAKGGIRFKITSRWTKKEIDSMVVTYYPKTGENALEHLYFNNRVLIEGEIRTRTVRKEGLKPIYSQDVIANKIFSVRKD